MEPSHLFVHQPPTISDWGYIDLTGQQLASAVTAFSIPAVGVHRDGRAFQRHGHALATGGRNNILLYPPVHCDLIGFLFMAHRITR